MKFSTLLALALTYTTLASAQDFRKDNADKAEQLTKEFAKLTKDSPCENNAQACVEDQFAQCVNGKFQTNSCGGGELKCVVLPLVNKPGTSITCSTEADRLARLADARGEKPPNNQTPDQGKEPGQGKGNDGKAPNKGDGKEPNKGDGKEPNKGDGKAPNKGDGKEPNKGDGKEPNKGDGKEPNKGDGKEPNKGDGKEPNKGDGKEPNKGDGKEPNQGDGKEPNKGDGNKGKEPKQVDGKLPEENLKTPPANGDGNLADIRKENAADAEALQEKFSKLKPDDKCTDNDVACVDNKFAQCSGGKFALTECASGTVCAALPLVLKKGTTVACTTEADRDARINDAKNNNKK